MIMVGGQAIAGTGVVAINDRVYGESSAETIARYENKGQPH